MLQKPVLADDEEEETEEDDGQVIDLDGVNGKKLAVLGGALVFADALSGLLTGLRSEDPIVVPFLNENRGLSEPGPSSSSVSSSSSIIMVLGALHAELIWCCQNRPLRYSFPVCKAER